ncbi:MAG: tRNA (adenosine(37)-N6)-threonylcarbamoyltransferase complex dimerization subunit type 1 TsaB [Paracoccaceae bacterium]
MPSDQLVLAFDTSAAHCAAALLSGDKVLAERVEEMVKGQAERLFPMLEELLSGASVTWPDLTRIGVGVGPGNFTGIRISVASARGLALSLAIPAIGVSTFEALGLGLPRPVVASVDARGGRFYLQTFAKSGAWDPVIAGADAMPADMFSENQCIVGFDSEEIAARIGAIPCQPQNPVAVAIAMIAATRDAAKAARPAPLYVRAPDAAPPRQLAPVILP